MQHRAILGALSYVCVRGLGQLIWLLGLEQLPSRVCCIRLARGTAGMSSWVRRWSRVLGLMLQKPAASVGGPERGPGVRVCFLSALCGSNAKHPMGL